MHRRQGLVIGVNTAIDARAQGIGFAIPIDNVKQIVSLLEKEGRVKRGFIGVNIAAIDETNIAEALTECCDEMDARLKRAVVQKSDHWHRRLLRTHRERPRRRGA